MVTYALLNEPSILDLSRDRSVIGQFPARGVEVYLVDWGEYSRLDATQTIDDFVTRYLRNCVEAACVDPEASAVHLHGYSTSAPPCVAFAALFPDRVATRLLQGPPLEFHVDEGIFQFNDYAAVHDADRVADVFGAVPATFLDVALSVRKPIEYTVTNPIRLLERLDDAEYVENFARKARWAVDGLNLPGVVYRQFIEEMVVENRLVTHRWDLGGRPVDHSAIRVPVLLIVGAGDKFVPRQAAEPLLEAVASDDTQLIAFPTTHVGLSAAAAAHEQGWSAVLDWLETHTRG